MSRIPIFNLVRSKSSRSHALRSWLAVNNVGVSNSSLRIRSLTTAAAPATKNDQQNKTKSQPKETSSLVMNMFNGHLRTEQVFPYPEVLTDEQYETLEMVKEPTGRLFAEYDPLKSDLEECLDEKYVSTLKDLGAYGSMVPVEYGGAGLTNTQFARLGEIMGARDLTVGVILGAHQSIGYKGILLFGNEKQKEKYLPDLAAGRKIAAFALTEPGSGSDASSIKTRAEKSADGTHYVLNGSKIWISNGGTADLITVFAKTPHTTSSGEVKDKVTAFIVERSFGGVSNGPPEKKMGIKASNTAEVYFENCKVPVENVIGQEGDGFKVAMNILNSGRFGMGAALTGTMKACIEKATEFATNRTQFGDKISNFGAIQEKLARMAMAHYATESLAYIVSGIMDRGYTDFQLEAAISKIYASEAAWTVCDEAIQILGGMGYMREAGLEKVMRDIRIFRIFEGTNDILRLFVGLTGLQLAGSHLKELQRAMNNPTANLGMIFDEGTKRALRAVGLGSQPSLGDKVAPQLKESSALATKSVENFGTSVEHLLRKYNKNIIHQQFLLNRLANSAIDIFVMMVVLSRATRSVNKDLYTAQHEINMTNVICSEAADRVQNNLAALRSPTSLKNFDLLKQVSGSICENKGVAHLHPIDRL
ncbi:Very long-chain specific acyl-CoA dehydrogenase, mitochondrial [Halotydeus destructor]|nr:Very long-chain specific acyl-CoA dehydrogenase, mitochondrial [Halotydeus destructor]